MKTTYQTGLTGENTAAAWLVRNKHMQILESRYRNRAGEIDLIMRDGDIIAFIEVKTRLHADRGIGLLSVDIRKQKRIANSAFLYLKENGWLNRAVRFDVAEVSASDVFYVPNAFQPGGMFYH